MTPEELQAISDRQALGSLSDMGRPFAAAADLFTLPVRGVMGAANTMLRLPNAFGAGIPYIPEEAFGGSSTSLTPYYDKYFRSGLPGVGKPTQTDPADASAGVPIKPELTLQMLLNARAQQGKGRPVFDAVGNSTARGVFGVSDYDKLAAIAQKAQEDEAALRKAHAEKMPVGDRAKRMKEFNLSNVLERKNPLHTRALSDAVLAWAGATLANQGDVGKGMPYGVDAWMKGRDREESQATAERDRRHKLFMEEMGLADKDTADLAAKTAAATDAAILAATGAKAGLPLRMHGMDEANKSAIELMKANAHLKAAGISARAQQNQLDQRMQDLALIEDYKRRGYVPSAGVQGVYMPKAPLEASTINELIKMGEGLDPAQRLMQLDIYRRALLNELPIGAAVPEAAKLGK